MYSSRKNIIIEIYKDSRTVFRLRDVAMLVGEDNTISISQRLNYAVKTGKLLNPRKGIYAKPDYNPEEVACLLYTPSYISLEYVLQKEGIVFQYDSQITMAGYLNRIVEIDGQVYKYRKIKGNILVDMAGIYREHNINIATKERAFLDVLYFNSDYYFDNLHLLDKDKILNILPLYGSAKMTKRIQKLLENV